MLDKDSLNWQLSVGVTYASLMSAVSLFFTGILIAQYGSFNTTIKVPIIFLIISTFSFIFAATIYSNAGSEITLGKFKTVEKYMIYAKNIVELLGLYLFILATPLVIGAVTRDGFLRTTTIIVAIVGFTLYSQSKFSILEKELPAEHKRYLSSVIVVLALLLYVTQSSAITGSLFLYSFVAIVLLIVLFASTTLFSLKSKQYKPVLVRTYVDDDAEELSNIILKNLDKVKSNRYPRGIIDAVKEQSSAVAIRKLAEEKQVFVAEFDSRVAGLACLQANKISTVFTNPNLHRKGIGRILVDSIENEIIKKHHYKDIEVSANIVDQAFYKKLGYQDVREVTDEDGDKTIIMQKKIFETIN